MKKIGAQTRAMLILAVGSALFLALLGCAPTVRTDLKGLQANPGAYEGKRVILTTDIESLIRDPGVYENRRVELTGRVRYQTTVDSSRWSFFLADKDGHSVLTHSHEHMR